MDAKTIQMSGGRLSGKTAHQTTQIGAASTQELIDAIKQNKRGFIAPKAQMKNNIENDANYLNALGALMRATDNQLSKARALKDDYLIAKYQVELYELIGKYQANEGLVRDKLLHYDNVFLPSYEKELEDSKLNFQPTLQQCKEIISLNEKTENRAILAIGKEVAEYEGSELRDDAEYQLHVYKTLRRLYAKATEKAQ